MSVNDRDIYATALIVIKEHGESAAYFAAERTANAIMGAEGTRLMYRQPREEEAA